ncbi:MAG: tripartite tricarboxylate transporter substrate binding protein [Desulfobacterales bacterium]|nr:tripartite tricarboxylate transporter substrate binding protein [Desulfobacterales bacterium]
MKKNLFSKLGLGAVVCLLLLCVAMPAAAGYPESPVSLIITYSAGGASDFQARLVTMLASNENYLGQPVVIINKPGAGGKVGWNWMVTKAPTDGYTMGSYNVPHFIAQSIKYKTDYNYQAFEPVANWGADPAVLIVPADSPFNTVKDLLDYAKENPGKVTVNGAGLYVGHHIAALQLMEATGVKLTYIPEKGGAPAMTSVVGGKVKAGFNNLSDAFRNQSRIKILAIADLERHEFIPEVPTFVELGYPAVDETSVNYRGVFYPKGTAPEIIEKASEVFVKMFKDPKVLKMMKNGGCPVKVMTRQQVQKMFNERQIALSKIFAKK